MTEAYVEVMSRSLGRAATAGVAIVLAVTGCAAQGSGPTTATVSASAPQVTSLSPAGVLAASRAALANHTRVHVSGSSHSTGKQVVIDLFLVRGKGGMAIVATPGLMAVHIVAIDGDLWLRGDKVFWTEYADAATADRIGAKWAHTTTTSVTPPYSDVIDYDTFLRGLLATTGDLAAAPGTEVSGVPTVGVRDTGEKGGTIYVRADADPVPLRIVRGGQVDLQDWDVPIVLTAPAAADVVELG